MPHSIGGREVMHYPTSSAGTPGLGPGSTDGLNPSVRVQDATSATTSGNGDAPGVTASGILRPQRRNLKSAASLLTSVARTLRRW
jgi:hypothetical protein